ncbi:MAG: DUF924 family protein [Geminicoccaceae bacterium]
MRGRHDRGDVLEFWFASGNEERWFKADPEFDRDIADRFAGLVGLARGGALTDWAATADGALAMCLLLDQFPRNIWRGTPGAFSCDERAREVAAAAILAGHDRAVAAPGRMFFYLPFEHSEDLAHQEHCLELMRGLDDPELLHWAQRHHAVIAQFGRFPHRNAILGRESTDAETEFLQQPGSSF